MSLHDHQQNYFSEMTTQQLRERTKRRLALKRSLYAWLGWCSFLLGCIHGVEAYRNGPQFDSVNGPICTALLIVAFLFWVLYIHVRDDQEK